MKKPIRKLIPVVFIVAVILAASSASAAPYVKGSKVLYGSNGYKIDLLQQTDIYNDPSDAHPVAALAPQVVSGLTEIAKGNDEGGHWYKIETWIGAKWIYSVREIVREKTYPGEKVMVSGYNSGFGQDEYNRPHVEETLYDAPFEDAKISWASLGKQNNVEAVDFAHDLFTGFGWYKIKTFIGEKWVHKLRGNPPKV